MISHGEFGKWQGQSKIAEVFRPQSVSSDSTEMQFLLTS